MQAPLCMSGIIIYRIFAVNIYARPLRMGGAPSCSTGGFRRGEQGVSHPLRERSSQNPQKAGYCCKIWNTSCANTPAIAPKPNPIIQRRRALFCSVRSARSLPISARTEPISARTEPISARTKSVEAASPCPLRIALAIASAGRCSRPASTRAWAMARVSIMALGRV